jgi:hypothetical protein
MDFEVVVHPWPGDGPISGPTLWRDQVHKQLLALDGEVDTVMGNVALAAGA